MLTIITLPQQLKVVKNFISPGLFRIIRSKSSMTCEVVTKKFLNTPDQIVDDSINGLVASNRNLQILQSCNRVVLRASLGQKDNSDTVSLIAGGGSGHEPFAAGFVGKGFLSAAVCGDIFTSPPSAHVTAALEAVNNKRGTVVLVINYTGDRLNFGLAIERFNQTFTEQAAFMVVIGDDVALEERGIDNVGRRGLAGAVLIMKIAGAMAENGIPAEKIAVVAQQANDCIGTLGLSLSACSIPGKSPMFTLEPNEMELGLGIHGEPGCERTSLLNVKSIVDLLLTRLEHSKKKCLVKGTKLAVLLNNLGGTSHIEMNAVAGEIRNWLHIHGYSVARFYSGTLMTSLDGHGISISILKIADDTWLDYLDAPTEAPAWIFKDNDATGGFNAPREISKQKVKETERNSGVALNQEESELFSRCLEKACKAIVEAREKLDKLDSRSGDGDCGRTLTRGAIQILSALKNGVISCSHPQNVFEKCSVIFEDEVGGTAGALYALMFSAAAAAFNESTLPASWHVALKKGLDAVMRYGEARPGYRSMVDPLHAAAEAIADGQYTRENWEKLVKAAEIAAKATASMTAQCGRASYTAEATQTEPDPGAIAVAIWLRAVYEAAFSLS